LVHMEHLMEIFGAGYAADPRVPHLVANATRSYFGHRSAKAAQEPVDPGADTSGTAAGTASAGASPAGATDPDGQV